MGARASAPLRRRRGSEAPSAEGPLELAIISDPGEDLCPALRAAHFSPHSVNVAGVRHQVVGRGDAATGVRDADALRKALADGIRDGIARAPGAARRAAR